MVEREHDSDTIEQIVARAVGQALQDQLPRLQEQVLQSVMEVLPSQPAAAPSSVPESSSALLRAVSSIHAGFTQKEILRALLDAGSHYCSRIALFVVKAGAASGWQARGFGAEEAVKDFPLDLKTGPAAQCYLNRTPASANVSEMGSQFVQHLGSPVNEKILLLPLPLKDKVAALVYADGGGTGKLNADSLELLVMATSAWLEVISLRKQAAPRENGESFEKAVPPVTVSSFSDPFAAHTPKHIPAASIPPEQTPGAPVIEIPAAHVAAATAAAAPAVASDPLAALSPEDAEVHRKAQRFARLLVDEIKLYNQAKVAEGRRNKDMYDRLKEDIDKSRGSFQKRYGNTAAASVDYFQNELLRSLAEDDLSVMGSNFPR